MNKIITYIPEYAETEFLNDDLKRMRGMVKVIANNCNNKKTRTIALRRIAIVIGVLFLGSGVTVAAATYVWKVHLSEYFNSSTKQENLLNNAGNVSEAMEEIVVDTSNGIKVQVEQSVAVKGLLYILLKVELPKGQVFSKNYVFQYRWIKTGSSYDADKVEEFTDSTMDRPELVDYDGNVGWFVCEVERTAFDFNGKQITILLEGLAPSHATESELLYDNPVGSWKLSYAVDCNDPMIREIEVDKMYELGGEDILINKIEITPLYMRIYHGDKNSNGTENLPDKIGLVLKDGTVIKKDWSYAEDAEDARKKGIDGGGYHQANFREIIEMNDIDVIMLDGKRITLE